MSASEDVKELVQPVEVDVQSGGVPASINPAWIEAYAQSISSENSVTAVPNKYNAVLMDKYAEAVQLAGTVPLGLEARKKLFTTDVKVAFLNHGSFGSSFVAAQNLRKDYIDKLEENTDFFMQRYVLPQLEVAARRLAGFVHCRPQDVVLVPNATSAANAVFRSLMPKLQEGDVLLVFNTVYAGCYNALKYVADVTKAQIVCMDVGYPYTQEAMETVLRETIALHGNKIKFALLEHISSQPPVVYPVASIVSICRQHNILSFVDGAHAIGNIPLDLTSINADFYCSNLHKWLCAGKSVALLHVNEAHQSWVKPNVVSYGYDVSLASEFAWAASQDYTVFMTVPLIFDLWEAIGVEKIMNYNRTLTDKATKLLTETWKTGLVVPLALQCNTMSAIFVPPGRLTNPTELHDILQLEYKIEVPVKAFRGQLYVRLSCHMYNHLPEYQRLADAVLEIQEIQTSKPQASS